MPANENSQEGGRVLEPGDRSAGVEPLLLLELIAESGHAVGLKHPFEGAVQLPPDAQNNLYVSRRLYGKLRVVGVPADGI